MRYKSPFFRCENLKWSQYCLRYRLSKPIYAGTREIYLTPEELLDKLAALIPSRKKQLHHYFGAFAPNAPKRKEVVSFAKRTLFESPLIRLSKISEKIKRASLTWAVLIKMIYEKDPLICPYGHKMRIVRFVTKGAEIYSTLFRLGLPTTLPELEEATGYENYDNYVETSEKFIDYLEMDSEVYIGTNPPKEIKFSTDYEEPDWPDMTVAV